MSNLRRVIGIFLEVVGLLLAIGGACEFPPSLIGKQVYTDQDFSCVIFGLALAAVGGLIWQQPRTVPETPRAGRTP